VQYITVGIAQYDAYAVSVKTMRYTNGRWSRQAEELPLHRPIDMTIFLAKALFDASIPPGPQVIIEKGTFENQPCDITIHHEVERTPGEINTYNAFIAANAGSLKGRLGELLEVLSDLKKRGRI
jgi:hypothetical protein